MKLDNLPELLKLYEVADILRVSTLTVKRWEKTNNLVPVRINKRGDRLYKREALLAFINKNK